MRLSIVTTLYHSAPYLMDFHVRVCAEAEKFTDNYEIIYVNDGSPDDSLAIATALYQENDRVRVIDLARNFGHHKALMTGLDYTRGALVFLLDCDLEEPPELLSQFYQEFENSGADVVYGVQQARKGSSFERLTGQVFYWFFNLLSSYPVVPNQVAARLMSQRYVTALVKHRDQEIFLAGLWAITGFKQIPVVVKKYYKGSTTYTFRRKVSLFINSITSFSNKPLVFIFYLGCGIVSLSSLAAFYLVMKRLFFGTLLIGWPSLIVSVWLLGGLNIFCLGVIGIYLSKVFTETKQRPYTVIRQVYDRSKEGKHELKRHQEECTTILYQESADAWSHSERG